MIVASKAKGRVVERLIERGDDVKSGQLIIQLDSPELMAQLRSAQATRDEAKAQLELSLHGTREESIRNLRANPAQAEAQYRNAQNDYNRNLSVAGKGYISKSELDASRRSRDTAFQQVQAAKANPMKASTATVSSSGSNMRRRCGRRKRICCRSGRRATICR